MRFCPGTRYSGGDQQQGKPAKADKSSWRHQRSMLPFANHCSERKQGTLTLTLKPFSKSCGDPNFEPDRSILRRRRIPLWTQAKEHPPWVHGHPVIGLLSGLVRDFYSQLRTQSLNGRRLCQSQVKKLPVSQGTFKP